MVNVARAISKTLLQAEKLSPILVVVVALMVKNGYDLLQVGFGRL